MSGHLQKVICIHGDCDDDTLLVQVEQTGQLATLARIVVFFIRFGREKHQSEDM
ncbi:MAG: phosphoribosyl-AMP cyclohydrolase [Christensenellales bacterium]